MVDGRKEEDQKKAEFKIDEYYSPLEVAEIKGLTKQSIIDGCKKGKFPGAVKTQPDRTNKQGLWLIPKPVIDNPNTEFVPALVQQPTDIAIIKNEFRTMIAEEYEKHLLEIKILHEKQIMFLQQQFESQNQQNNEKILSLEKKLSDISHSAIMDRNEMSANTNEINKNLNQLITETRKERSYNKKNWWQKLWSDD